ncbi:MAG: hypothetical protein ACE5G6_06655 [Terriglobia bacterium]
MLGFAQQNKQRKGIPTKVMVRAVTSDAKIIGDAVGGARITLRDAATGEVLAEGIQKGKTGNTELIMGPHGRGATIYDTPGAAGFEATLELERPTRVEVTAEGPLGYPQARQKASKTVLLVPGHDVLGEGILLTIHGFIVEVLAPTEEEAPAGQPLLVQARVRMA